MRPNVKPLTHWIIYQGYSVRFKTREPHRVTGLLTTPDGPIPFVYAPNSMTLELPSARVTLNEHGWEVTRDPIT